MPFKGPIVGRALLLLGSAGQKIKAFVDVNGFPRIDFYTGSEDEIEPGSIRGEFENSTEPTDDVVKLVLSAPLTPTTSFPGLVEIRSGGAEHSRVFITAEEVILDSGNGNSVTLFPTGGGVIINSDGSATAPIRLFKSTASGFNEIKIQDDSVNITADGFFTEFRGRVDFLEDAGGLNGIKGLFGKRALNWDFGEATDTCSGGTGTLNFAHNFPNTAFHIVANPTSAGGARFLTRTPANDTSTTFQCRAWNDAGGNPANGTSVTCQYVGFQHT